MRDSVTERSAKHILSIVAILPMLLLANWGARRPRTVSARSTIGKTTVVKVGAGIH